MKLKTALAQSRMSVRFLAVAAPLAWLLYFWVRYWPIALFAVLLTFTLVGDVINIIAITRRQRRDPDALNRRIS